MDWTVAPFEGANHRPALVVNGIGGTDIVAVEARVGKSLTLGDIYPILLQGQRPGVYFHVVAAETLREGVPVRWGWLPPFACGMILSGLGVGGLAFGLSVLGLDYLPWWLVAGLIGLGAVASAAYIRHARRTKAPLALS